MPATPEPGDSTEGKPLKLLGILDDKNIPCAQDSMCMLHEDLLWLALDIFVNQ